MQILLLMFIIVIFHGMIAMISKLLSQNKKQMEEQLSLLNWIKIGLILRESRSEHDALADEDPNVYFSNKQTNKIFKKHSQLEEFNLSEDDFNKHIFKKINFTDKVFGSSDATFTNTNLINSIQPNAP